MGSIFLSTDRGCIKCKPSRYLATGPTREGPLLSDMAALNLAEETPLQLRPCELGLGRDGRQAVRCRQHVPGIYVCDFRRLPERRQIVC